MQEKGKRQRRGGKRTHCIAHSFSHDGNENAARRAIIRARSLPLQQTIHKQDKETDPRPRVLGRA